MPIQPASQSARYDDPSLWVDRYGDVLLRFANARLSGRDQAEDIVQETFLSAYRHREKFDGKSGSGT
ncbi:MAG: sigma factor [Planctomycetota bacterium]|nr:sigma factor [Planctomycetota bacterium]